MDHTSHFRPRFIDFTMNDGFIGRFESGLSLQALPCKISQDNVARHGEEKPGLGGPPATDQHPICIISRAHMAGGFFEQTQFGENAARERHLPRQRSVFFHQSSSCMQANCK